MKPRNPAETAGQADSTPRNPDGGLSETPAGGTRPPDTFTGAGEARRRERVAHRLAEMPSKCRPLYRDVMEGRRSSPRRAIRAFCQMCVGWEDYAQGIRDCTDPACPLFRHRPYQGKGTEA